MDRFDAMRIYVRIVERSSFSRAASDLDISRTAATDAVKSLEQRLGTRLLQRTTRQVVPTPEGEAFHARCLDLLAALEEAEGAFRASAPRGVLRIAMHGTMARRLFFPKLPEFLARHPDVELDVIEGDGYVDLVREGVDCAVRAGELRDSGLVARPLTMLAEATAASAAYCRSHGLPDDLASLEAGHRMVGFRSSHTASLVPLSFQSGDGIHRIGLPTRVRVDGAESYLGAALAGLGIIQSPAYRLQGHFDDGSLIPLLRDFPPPGRPVNILHPRTRQPSPRLRAFIDWAVDAFGDPD